MRASVFLSIYEMLKASVAGTRSILRGLSTAVPYLFNINPNALRKEITEQYPDPVSSKTVDDLPPRTRGLLVNDINECIGCYECAKVCPTECIEIQSERQPATQKEWVSLFNIDNSRCVFCGLCVEVCPTGSIKHSKKYEAAAYEKREMISSFGKGDMPRKGGEFL